MTQHSLTHDEPQAHGNAHDRAHDHDHDRAHAHGHADAHESLAELLDLDALVLADHLGEVAGWIADRAPSDTATVVDLGAGTGTGTTLLASSFRAAEIVAVDVSPQMLARTAVRAAEQGAGDRVRTVEADLDAAWPDLGAGVVPDVVWAASSLHHVADPERLLREAFAALRPGGVLAVVEMIGFPRFLPDGLGRSDGGPSLEERCHQLLSDSGWNHHPDWSDAVRHAGFDRLEKRTFDAEVVAGGTVPAATMARYARLNLGRVREFLDDRAPAGDLALLDEALTPPVPGADDPLGRATVRVRRTVWLAIR
ncbi:hypothetical protein GCM10025865_12150 [Paraoerskovia sediminicola]|uniref:Methyltransferase type 12 domain-containing protein n=1 Tax=Paraoerskovia sediminicola TaxID=1138587 RepID=A0ABN6XAT0_9CELL|nr:class I SAM-dependent methyltransferase [Paraoerskovia sediminicola]BDZ41916.1 hypothetical protein GCM10025865_12150 [Paraoerskovia sediminicola]